MKDTLNQTNKLSQATGSW